MQAQLTDQGCEAYLPLKKQERQLNYGRLLKGSLLGSSRKVYL